MAPRPLLSVVVRRPLLSVVVQPRRFGKFATVGLSVMKALAHLTTTRVQYDTSGKEWDLEAIRQELEGIIRRFLTSLPTDKAAWFDAVRKKRGRKG